jgi:hypothetical protein
MAKLQDSTVKVTIDPSGSATPIQLLAILASRAKWGWGSFLFGRLTMVTMEQGDDVAALPVLAIQAIGAPIIIQITEAELASLGPCPNLNSPTVTTTENPEV